MSKALCRIADCPDEARHTGLCVKHYTRNYRYGDPLATRQHTRGTCTFPGCTEPHYGNGLCNKHRKRKIANGDPGIVQRIRNSDEKRFWTKVDKDGPVPAHRPDLGPCWVWISPSVNKSGYGAFRLGKTHVQAHRYAYELLVKAIPGGLVIDHLCLNILCTNPAHMEPVTAAENSRRMWVRRKATGWQSVPKQKSA